VYNPVEIQQIKDTIKLTLLLKKRAHPTKVTCCKNINVLTELFFHKKECNGLLYFGEYNNKTIIVCDKCKAINFLLKFIWTCPICGTRFKDKGLVNNEEKINKFLSPANNKRKISYRKNIFYENEINNENNDINNNNICHEKRSNNSSRKNKETLSSILKRKNLKNINDLNNNDKDYDNNLENNPNINNSINANHNSKKELNNNEKTNIPQIREVKIHQKILTRNQNILEKSLTELKVNKTYKKKKSILDKPICGNIEPIKEETESKFNSPGIPKANGVEMLTDKYNLNEPLTTKNSRKITRFFIFTFTTSNLFFD
jgi:hypothetical protein